MNRMLWLIVAFLIVNKVCSQEQKCQLKTKALPYHECDVFYETCDDENLKFQGCIQIYCQYYYDGSCLKFGTNKFTENQCFQACCPQNSTKGYQFNADNLHTCKLESDRKQSIWMGAVGGVIGGLLFIVLIAYICIRCDLCEKFCYFFTCQCFKTSQEDQAENAKETTLENMKESNLQLWQSDYSVEAQGLLGPCVSCTICLSMNTDCITKCGHPFHSKCLDNYIQKKVVCPNCFSTEMGPVKIYCKSCLRNYIEFDSSSHQSMSSLFQRMNGQKCQTCKNL